MIKDIRHIGIVVSDLVASLRFYKLLGFKVDKQMIEKGDYIDKISSLSNVKVTTVKMRSVSGQLIELLYYHSHKKISKKCELSDIGITHFAVTVDDIEYAYRELSKVGISFNSQPQLSPDGNAKLTFCQDPDGVFIELVEMLK